jgi:hypothetical protein
VTPEIEADRLEAWIGLERYAQNLRFGAFYGYVDVEPTEAAASAFARSDERYVVSAQYRLGGEDGGLWLGVTYGDTGVAGGPEDEDGLTITLNFAPQPAYKIDWDPDN